MNMLAKFSARLFLIILCLFFINGCKTFKNYKIQVPIKITFYNNSFKTINLNELNLSLSGVNCNLWGKSGIFIINEGIKIVYIDFILNGTVGSGIYTMLDFIDNNGNGMSFSIMKPLK